MMVSGSVGSFGCGPVASSARATQARTTAAANP
jgi:hypothetical protein